MLTFKQNPTTRPFRLRWAYIDPNTNNYVEIASEPVRQLMKAEGSISQYYITAIWPKQFEANPNTFLGNQLSISFRTPIESLIPSGITCLTLLC
jgi:hypothetical protein